MALPKAIQRQVDEAAAVETALAQQQAQAAEALVTEASQLLTATDAPVAAPAPAETPPPPPPPPAVTEDWQQKYRSLQGMFAQKTSELQTQVRSYESQMAQLQKQLDVLMQARQQEEAKEKAAADPKDVENFGADMVDMVQRYAERVYQGMAAQFGAKAADLEKRIGSLEQQVTGVATKTNVSLEQQFYATLKSLVPDWEEVNQEQRWLTWLAETDPIYGAPRQAALDAAHQQMDAQRVANVFKAFKAAQPPKAQSALANQVAPNGAAASVPTAAASKPVISSKFVEKFFTDLAKGRYTGREKEAANIEAEINLAAAEGRIR